jgi:hypothetical protein
MAAASIPWVPLFLLGAAHGINPAMGWLFAVARGLQERDRRAVWRALGPLAAGHALAIGCAIAVAFAVGSVLPMSWLRWVVAVSLLAVGVDGLVHHRHVRLGGMRVNGRQLATWSFLMASAHGAGLMVVPLLLRIAGSQAIAQAHNGHAAHAAQVASAIPPVPIAGLWVAIVHTVGYLLVTGLVAVVVYERLGLRLLGRAWFNIDRLWAGALILTAVVTPLIH